LTWIERSDRYCWNNFSQSFITIFHKSSKVNDTQIPQSQHQTPAAKANQIKVKKSKVEANQTKYLSAKIANKKHNEREKYRSKPASNTSKRGKSSVTHKSGNHHQA